jgi:hypothetical protein
MRPVFFVAEAFETALAAFGPQHEGNRKGRGRRRRYDREQIKNFVFELMDHHGEFVAEDPEWRSQADLERAVLEKLNALGLEPAVSTVRDLIREPLEEWHRSRVADN